MFEMYISTLKKNIHFYFDWIKKLGMFCFRIVDVILELNCPKILKIEAT
jgi:hypothetical protein